jgi:hypothetical protein
MWTRNDSKYCTTIFTCFLLLWHYCIELDLPLELCHDLGVVSYPSLYFIGYGNFYQSGSYKSNIVKYNADIYPDAILVWLRMLNTISSYQQKWDMFRSLLPFSSHKTRLHHQHTALVSELDELQRGLQRFTLAEERAKAMEMFDEGVDRGDVFPLLSTIDPTDEVTQPASVQIWIQSVQSKCFLSPLGCFAFAFIQDSFVLYYLFVVAVLFVVDVCLSENFSAADVCGGLCLGVLQVNEAPWILISPPPPGLSHLLIMFDKNTPLTSHLSRTEDPSEEEYCGIITECAQESMKPEVRSVLETLISNLILQMNETLFYLHHPNICIMYA